MRAYWFDTETTSRDDDREIIEAAWLPAPIVADMVGVSDEISLAVDESALFCQRYQPTRPIDLGALAVHHILPVELVGMPPCSDCRLPADAEYVVGHSIDFDWKAIGAPANVKRICTDAMSRWVFPDATAHSQSALIYLTLGATSTTRERLRNAHSAAADVMNNVELLRQIIAAAPVTLQTWSELYAYSEQCRIPRVMPIGEKQGLKGLTLDEALEADPGFIGWCLRQEWLDPYLAKGLEQAIERRDAVLNARFASAPAAAGGKPNDFDDDLPF